LNGTTVRISLTPVKAKLIEEEKKKLRSLRVHLQESLPSDFKLTEEENKKLRSFMKWMKTEYGQCPKSDPTV